MKIESNVNLMPKKQQPTNPPARNQFIFLTFTHTVLDSYATLFSHILPFITSRFATEVTRNSFAGVLIAIFSIFSSLGQVLFGWLSDRFRSVHFITFGVGCTAIGLSLVGIAPSVWMVFSLLAIGGLGVAAFHPQATTYAGALAAETRGMGIAIFLTGGNIGRAVGPLLLLLLPYFYDDLNYLAWEMQIGILVAILVPIVLDFDDELDLTASARVLTDREKTGRQSFWRVAQPHLLPLIVLFIIASLRTVTIAGLENFLSLYLKDLNYSNWNRSLVIALFIFAGSIGIMGSGWLLSRMNTLVLLLLSLIVAPPLLLASLHTGGIFFLVLLFLGNMVLTSSVTINIILAQMMLRGHESIAASFMMGASWGVGGLLNLIVGALGDKYGLPIVLDGLVIVPLLISPLMFLLRKQPDLSKTESG